MNVFPTRRARRETGLDMDLSYITPQLIAMGFPAEGVEEVRASAASVLTCALR